MGNGNATEDQEPTPILEVDGNAEESTEEDEGDVYDANLNEID